ncbi:MAG: hypothetical protein MUO26_15350 [Methanotrichaceae archaeon]|nr:hypothetical protein [Methanotrichaceae archaeon]
MADEARMIFDPVKMNELSQKNPNCWTWKIHQSGELEGEKAYLENLIGQVPHKRRDDWVSRLQSKHDTQQIAAWFEVMLYRWLKEFFDVDPEPDIKGNNA